MYGSANGRNANEEECAAPEDLQLLFTEQMEALHTLSFLLTADESKAEKCFVAGLEDSLEANHVFRQWARSWARRSIIRNAIRLIAPAPSPESKGNEVVDGQADFQPCTEQEAIMNAVIKLPAFERFVFVLSVLEGHSLSDTASLLGCTNSQLAQARSRALAHIAGYLAEANLVTSPGDPQPHWYARLEIA